MYRQGKWRNSNVDSIQTGLHESGHHIGGALGELGAFGKFGEMNALASTSAPYQALVCIFLAGGNDGHNMVIPIATAQQNYSVYAQGRQNLAQPLAGLQGPIQNGSDTYGLHPLMPEMASLYNAGQCGHSGQCRHAGAAHYPPDIPEQ